MTRRRALVAAVWIAPSLVFVVLTAAVYAAFRIDPPIRLPAESRAAVIAPLRAALGTGDVPSCTAHGALSDHGPVAVTLWVDGRQTVRVDGYGDDLGAATDAAARALRDDPKARALTTDARAHARIQVDIVGGRGPLPGGAAWFDAIAVPGLSDILAVNPGLEGIGARFAIAGGGSPREVLLLPHELVLQKLVAAKRPSDAVPELAIGVDLAQIDVVLAGRAAASPRIGRTRFRFRTDTFVEDIDHTDPSRPPIQLTRGIPPPPPLTAANLRAAALAGGRYLVAHLATNGRYIYENDLTTGTHTEPTNRNAPYSIPRHAGSTYFLAELYRITHESWLREPIERAFAHLAELIAAGRCGGTAPDGTAFDCVIDRGEGEAQLGSTALTVVALVEYQRATGDTRYLALARTLTAWLMFMQRADGSFRHAYDPRTHTPNEHYQTFYYSGEAALALARMAAITSDPAYALAATRAVDWLVDWYDFFVGGFFYGEEHWTCIAAEALWPIAQRDDYRTFCAGYGAFLRGQQPARGDFPDEDDLAGGYAVTPFVVPYNTPSGSRTEAMISAYLLGRHHGQPDPALRAQIGAALAYVLGQQVRPEGAFDVVGNGLGGIPGTPIDRSVRIDYVQHVCSAMIRASELWE